MWWGRWEGGGRSAEGGEGGGRSGGGYEGEKGGGRLGHILEASKYF